VSQSSLLQLAHLLMDRGYTPGSFACVFPKVNIATVNIPLLFPQYAKVPNVHINLPPRKKCPDFSNEDASSPPWYFVHDNMSSVHIA